MSNPVRGRGNGTGAVDVTMQPVLLVHSSGFTSRQWRKLSELLAPTHRVLAPDLLGYGASGPWPVGAPFHFRQDLAMLEALLEDASAPVHVVGHSYGGFLALQLALARPASVRSLTLFEPVAFGILDEASDAEAHRILGLAQPHGYDLSGEVADEAWLAQFVDWWNGPGAWAGLPAETKFSFRAVGWKVSQEVASLIADTTDRATYGTITAPTLLLGGDRSPFPERRVLDKLAAALPKAELQILTGMGHVGPITHAARVNAAIALHVQACSTS